MDDTMKPKKTSQFIALGAVAALAIVFIVTQTSLLSVITSSPWWMYGLIIGILFSGYMWVKTMKEENEADQEWIEQEGNVYMARLEAAKARREAQQK